MNYDQASEAARQLPLDDPGRFFAGAIALLREDYPELLLPYAFAAVRNHPTEARVWQAQGLAARACGDSRSGGSCTCGRGMRPAQATSSRHSNPRN